MLNFVSISQLQCGCLYLERTSKKSKFLIFINLRPVINGPSGQLSSPQPYPVIVHGAQTHLKSIGCVKLTHAYDKNLSTTKKLKKK